MKKPLKIVVVLLSVVVALLVIVNLFLGPMVRTAVTKGGSSALGAPVELAKCSIRLLRGQAGINGLVVRSPEGFRADSVFKLGEVAVDMDPGSVFSDTIHIRRVFVKDPLITYEQALSGNNIGKLLSNISGGKPAGGAAPETTAGKETSPAKPAKRVIIDDVTIEGGQITLAVKGLGGRGLPIPLPTLRITDIGKASGGASIIEATGIVIGAVLKGVIAAVGSVGEMAVDGVKATAGLVGDTGKAAADAAKDLKGGATKALKGLGGLLGGEKKSEGSR